MSKVNQKYLALGLFFFSGFSALIYEIIWARLLSLVFGTSIEAISAVLTAFMFGLALGSYFGGRHADYVRKHLSAYAITEILIGISSIILYFAITNLPYILNDLNSNLHIEYGHVFTSIVYLLNFLLVAIPTTLMGATFPLITKHYVTNSHKVGLGIGILYGINTLGAVMGTFLCGFYLIPTLGVMETNFLAALISISLGVVALFADRNDRRIHIFNIKVFIAKSKPNLVPLKDREVMAVMIMLLITGFASMAYEVVWTKFLVLIIGNSTYAFSAILTVFLLGIALGSFILVKNIDKFKDLFFVLALIELGIFVFVAGTLPFLDNIPIVFQFLYNKLDSGFLSFELITFIIVLIIVFIPAVFMGAAFPVANKIVTLKTNCLGHSVGSSYSANTLGGIFGAFLAGFYFIPTFGVEKTILLISSLSLLTALALFAKSKKLNNSAKTISILVAGSFFAFYVNWLPEWNHNILNRGVYAYADWFKENLESAGDMRAFIKKRYELEWFKEGKTGTVAVTRIGTQLSLQINGKTEGSTGKADMRTQVMVAALPLMLNDKAENIAIIGLGTGISLGVAEQFPVKHIDCIELSKDVIEAASYFNPWNHNAVNDAKVKMIMADGRNYLTYTEKKYDVIINEPSNPWISGVSNLFTLEFFKVAASRLKEGGIMAQWIQLYNLPTKELKTLLNTFKKAFPHISVWVFSPTDLIVLGSRSHEINNWRGIEKAFYQSPVLYQDLKALSLLSPSDVMRGYLFGTDKASSFLANAALNTDNYPIIEFEAPKALHLDTNMDNINALRDCC